MVAYDKCLELSHIFNQLDAKGSISNIERQEFILRLRNFVCNIAKKWLNKQNEE